MTDQITAEQIEKAAEAAIPWLEDELCAYPHDYHPRAVEYAREHVSMIFRAVGFRIEGDET
ncbi:hypothetical protein [Nesterenkonia suensis]